MLAQSILFALVIFSCTQLGASSIELEYRKVMAIKTSCWHANFTPPSAPVDHTPKPFLISRPSLCAGEIFLLIAVHTSVKNRQRRDLIRSTWASVRNIRGDRLVTIFVVGTTPNASLTASLQQEAASQGDIVQADFHDAYRNLTYKHLYWIKWVAHHCPKVRFVMKTDDDIMVNVFHLHLLLSESMIDRRNFFYCSFMGGQPIRQRYSQYFVSRYAWPLESYDDYCSGFTYVMSGEVVPKLHFCSRWRKYIGVDDAFVSGALRKALKVDRLQFRHGWASADMGPAMKTRQVDSVIVVTQFSNRVSPTLARRVWKAMLRYSYD